jgi:4-hydroxybenzoate polyprenyltransferase
MALEKFRAFMDLGRVQGISTTAAIALLGAFTSTGIPTLAPILWIVVISILAHSGGAAINELWDRKLDAGLKELSRKPMVSGIISVKEARAFIIACILGALFLAQMIFGFAAFVAILISCIWLVWYCTFGKRTFLVNDFAFSVGYPAYALFGALAVGMPTTLTWVFLGIVAAVSAFSQWENGLKDADNDRKFGIPSIAIRSGVSSENGISPRHPFYIYGVGIKLVFLVLCIVPIFLMKVPVAYIMLVILVGVPDQILTMKMFLGRKARSEYVKAILADVPLSWLVGSAIAILSSGWLVYIGLTLFLVEGYLIGSTLQSGAEFKLKGSASPLKVAPAPTKTQAFRPCPTPIMMTWAPAGPSGLGQVRSELICTRPQDPRPPARGKTIFRRTEEVYIVTPIN